MLPSHLAVLSPGAEQETVTGQPGSGTAPSLSTAPSSLASKHQFSGGVPEGEPGEPAVHP